MTHHIHKLVRDASRTLTVLLLLGAAVVASPTGPRPNWPKLSLELMDAHLVVVPAAHHVRLVADGKLISCGQAWEVKSVGNGCFHLRLRRWREHFWRIDGQAAWEVRGGTFGVDEGGRQTRLPLEVRRLRDPASQEVARFHLALPKLEMDIEPGRCSLRMGKRTLLDCVPLNVVALTSDALHVKASGWRGVYWQVDLEEHRVCEVRGGRFGGLGGLQKPAAVRMRTR